MGKPAIIVEGLGKKYKIGLADKRKRTFGEALIHNLSAPFHRARKLGARSEGEDTFWALQDASFEVQAGEVVGIIGRNGAGKSTLLKILSRITDPTAGRAVIRGRVGSLLEVGTGFHPELTGRENVYLNGAILGMKRAEIARKFDEIVAFAEVERFLDTPVKHYSSGMYVRLAFAVAAHLDPEILFVDEVLAVGDIAFQNKCLGKMDSVARHGRSVIVVSHNMQVVKQLCPRAILLEAGRLKASGDSQSVISAYLKGGEANQGCWRRPAGGEPAAGIYLKEVRVLDASGNPATKIEGKSRFFIEVTCVAVDAVKNAEVALRVINEEGMIVFTTTTSDARREWRGFAKGPHTLRACLDSDFLYPGRYTTNIATLAPSAIFDVIENEVTFEVDAAGNIVTRIADGRKGVVSPIVEWTEDGNALQSLP